LKHVVMFSGGVGSWATAQRVAERHGTKDLILLFADTKMEDQDLYRFLDEAAANVGGQFVKVAEGRDPWKVFFDRRFLGNSRIDPCSSILKREFLRRWIEDRLDPSDTTIYLGIDWTEIHRMERSAKYWKPWTVEAPLCEKPYLDKDEQLTALEVAGIRMPRLYTMGFPHNNCGGFCIKAGQAHFKLLLEKMPERYRYHEEMEQRLRQHLEKDVAILRHRGGPHKGKPLTLRDLRLKLEAKGEVDPHDWGGCGCFSDVTEEVA